MVASGNFLDVTPAQLGQQAGLGFGVKRFQLVWVFETQQAFDISRIRAGSWAGRRRLRRS